MEIIFGLCFLLYIIYNSLKNLGYLPSNLPLESEFETVERRLGLRLIKPPRGFSPANEKFLLVGIYKDYEIKIGIQPAAGVAANLLSISLILGNHDFELDVKHSRDFTMREDRSSYNTLISSDNLNLAKVNNLNYGIFTNEKDKVAKIFDDDIVRFFRQYSNVLVGNLHWNNNELTYGELLNRESSLSGDIKSLADTLVRLADKLSTRIHMSNILYKK